MEWDKRKEAFFFLFSEISKAPHYKVFKQVRNSFKTKTIPVSRQQERPHFIDEDTEDLETKPSHSPKVTSGQRRRFRTRPPSEVPQLRADPSAPPRAEPGQPGLPARRGAGRGDPGRAGATAPCSTAPQRLPGPGPPAPGAAGSPCGRWRRGPGLPPPLRSQPGSALGVGAPDYRPASRPERARRATARVQPGPCSLHRHRGRARETKTAGLRLPLKGRVSGDPQVARVTGTPSEQAQRHSRVAGWAPPFLLSAEPQKHLRGVWESLSAPAPQHVDETVLGGDPGRMEGIPGRQPLLGHTAPGVGSESQHWP